MIRKRRIRRKALLSACEGTWHHAENCPEKSPCRGVWHTPGGGGAAVNQPQSVAHAEKRFSNGEAQFDDSSRRSAADTTIRQAQLIDN